MLKQDMYKNRITGIAPVATVTWVLQNFVQMVQKLLRHMATVTI